MKIVLSGDWHIRATATRYRTNEYYQQQLEKVKWIVKFAGTEADCTIIQPGDFFDTSNTSDSVAGDIVDIIDDTSLLTIFGQHDLKYRVKDGTKLNLLIKTGFFDLLNKNPLHMSDNVYCYGTSFNEEIPKPIDKNAFNILAIHKMVIENEKLFQDQEDFITAKDLSKTLNEYQVIVCGDNHKSFSYIPKNGTKIINCGSLMRMNTTQYEHKPCIWLLDTNTNKLTQHFIPVEPTTKVFKEEAIEMKERDEKLEAYIETLANTKATTNVSFEDNVKNIIREQKLTDNIEKLANEFIENFHLQEG